MRRIRHLTPRYIFDRLRVMSFQYQHPDAPWLTADVIAFLSSWLRPSDHGLEFGSGRSTAWFAQRVHHLMSVEHHPTWYMDVKRMLQEANLSDRVTYRLCEDGVSEQSDSSYVQVTQEIAPGSLDFVLVDGMAREHCAMECVDKVKPGGILIVDNVNWYLCMDANPSRAPNSRPCHDWFASETWQTFAARVATWRLIWSTNGVWDTAMWFKPLA